MDLTDEQGAVREPLISDHHDEQAATAGPGDRREKCSTIFTGFYAWRSQEGYAGAISAAPNLPAALPTAGPRADGT